MTTLTNVRSDRRAALVPFAALLAAMVSIQFGSALAEEIFPVVGAQGATTLRLTIGAAMLTLVMRPWRTKVSKQAAPALLGYAVMLAAMNLLFYLALRTIPLGVAVALEFTGPLLVAALSSRSKMDFAWVGLAVVGILLLSPLMHPVQPLDLTGIVFGLGAGACWALYIVFGQKVGREIGHHATAMGTLIAALLVLPIGLAHGVSLVQPLVLVTAVGVGLFSSALPFSLEMVALTRLPARAYGTMTALEPGIGALMGFALLHQHLGATQWTGIAAVMLAAAGSATTAKTVVLTPE